MDTDSVLEVLELLARMMSDVVRSENTERLRRIGAWAWGLLGKCREVGEMATEDVGTIRNLGKRAATILRKIQETENKRSQEEEDSGSPDSDMEEMAKLEMENQHANEVKMGELPVTAEAQGSSMPDDSEQSELEAAKARLQARIQDGTDISDSAQSVNEALFKQTRSLLDMVITVVGEFYGQRDLLEAREIWA
jgi:regulator of vacuolar morphogenesis